MGYDDGECVECRLEANGGNNCTDLRYNICMKCLDNVANDSHAMDFRLFKVLKENMTYNQICNKCGCESAIVFDVSVCKEHYDCCGDSEESE